MTERGREAHITLSMWPSIWLGMKSSREKSPSSSTIALAQLDHTPGAIAHALLYTKSI